MALTGYARKTAARLTEVMAAHPGLSPERPALIGVSGGRDSVALLHFLASTGWNKLRVAHLNHQLRGRVSERDASFVQKMAENLGLKCAIGEANIGTLAVKQKLSVETAGRNARRHFFLILAKRHRCRVVFMGHHAEDQAETVLQNLFRGAALRGVGGMAAAAPLGESLLLVRPALDASRKDVDEYIEAHGLKYREDRSNASLKFTRNRVRHELLPLLDDIFRREVSPIITRFAEQARLEDDFVQAMVDGLAGKKSFLQPDGSLSISAKFRKQHAALQQRILWGWLASQNPRIGNREIQLTMAMLKPGAATQINLPGGAHLRHDGRRLWLESPGKTTGRKARSPRPSKRR